MPIEESKIETVFVFLISSLHFLDLQCVGEHTHALLQNEKLLALFIEHCLDVFAAIVINEAILFEHFIVIFGIRHIVYGEILRVHLAPITHKSHLLHFLILLIRWPTFAFLKNFVFHHYKVEV